MGSDEIQPAFPGVFGQESAIAQLAKCVAEDRVASAYLFTGPSGVGKKTVAFSLVRTVLCERRIGMEPCGRCASCGVTASLVQLHPSLLLFEDLLRPVCIRRGTIMSICGYGSGEQQQYLSGMTTLSDLGLIEFMPSSGDGADQVDVFVRNSKAVFDKTDSKSVSGNVIEKSIELVHRDVSKSSDIRPLRLAENILRNTSAGLYQNTIKVSMIRNTLQKAFSTRSLLGSRHICIIDDAHNMQEPAQNCLLKTLEEPPLGSAIILVTDNVSALLPTILSRCQVVNFQRLRTIDIERFLVKRRGAEAKDANLITSIAGGSLGKAISLNPEDLRQRRGIARNLLDCILGRRSEDLFSVVESALLGAESTMAQKRRWTLGLLEILLCHIRDAMLANAGLTKESFISADDESTIISLADACSREQLEYLAEALSRASEKIVRNADIRLTLEAMILGAWLKHPRRKPDAG
ncbi:hypothetical protein J7M28_06260 [bacterium]|nr:hypothetical protein [bacterium]